MKRIAAFIDFTEGCKIALKQAGMIAKTTGAELHAVYILSSGDIAEKENEVRAFAASIHGMPVPVKVNVGTGELFEGALHTLRHLQPDLVVVGTHGIKGIKQHLFGAHILKLVQVIPFPCIVMQENSKVYDNGWDRILFPVSSHPSYQIMVEQSAKLAKIYRAELIQYEIDKSPDVDEDQKENTRMAREYFEANLVRWNYTLEEASVVSVGNSRQELKYAHEHGIGLICALAEIPPSDISLGKAEMENLLTNEFGIPILCCNE